MKRTILALPLLAFALGCGGSGGPVSTHPVEGRVLYAGKPAAGVKVFFYPTSAPTVPRIPSNPRGVTGADGRFSLSTFAKDDGAAEGGYQVILLWPPEPVGGGRDEESDSDRLLGWYTAVHSKLTAQIKPGANAMPDISLPAVARPPEAAEGVPGRN